MRFFSLLALVATSFSLPATAADFDAPSFKTLDEGKAVRILPRGKSGFGRAFAAFRSGALSLDDTMRQSLGLTRVSKDKGSHSYKILLDGVPVCGYQVRAVALKGQDILALGRVPSLEQMTPTSASDWPSQDRVFDVAAAQLSNLLAGSGVRAAAAERCYVVRDGAPRPAWKLQLVADGKPYTAIADEAKTYQIDRLFFDVADGKATVYPENSVSTPTLADVPLPGLVGNELETALLKTSVTSGHTRASEPTHEFAYAPGDDRFSEVSAFTHAVAHMKFLTDHGFEYYDAVAPMLIEVHKSPGGHTNNALFTPAIGGAAPSITIGDGDGIELKDLAIDGDVVSHELGHLVLFKNVITTSGHSLVLHEGLADFLAFARSGNACLGESICPMGSGACVLEGQCLRSGELDLKYEDDQWKDWLGPNNRLGHLHGQVISGMLWDLNKSGAMPLDVLTTTVMTAMTYLPEESTFENFIDSLITANFAVSGTKYDAAIRQAVTTRGMAEFLPDGVPPIPGTETDPDDKGGSGEIADTEPAAPAPAPAPAPAAAEEPAENKKDKKKDSPFSCGVVRNEEKTPDFAGALLILILALPVTLSLTSARASSSRGRKG